MILPAIKALWTTLAVCGYMSICVALIFFGVLSVYAGHYGGWGLMFVAAVLWMFPPIYFCFYFKAGKA